MKRFHLVFCSVRYGSIFVANSIILSSAYGQAFTLDSNQSPPRNVFAEMIGPSCCTTGYTNSSLGTLDGPFADEQEVEWSYPLFGSGRYGIRVNNTGIAESGTMIAHDMKAYSFGNLLLGGTGSGVAIVRDEIWVQLSSPSSFTITGSMSWSASQGQTTGGGTYRCEYALVAVSSSGPPQSFISTSDAFVAPPQSNNGALVLGRSAENEINGTILIQGFLNAGSYRLSTVVWSDARDEVGAAEFMQTAMDLVLYLGDCPASLCPPCRGDIADDFGTLGSDDQVSFGDFLALLGLIGPCPGGTAGCTGDIADDFGTLDGGDGQVSFGDFLALLGLIGPCP